MSEKNINYNQINNPTQINIDGNKENSVQTVGRKVKETIKDPQPLIDGTTSLVNTLIKSFFKSILTLLRCAIVPFFICYYLAFFLIGLFNTMGKTTIEVLIIGTKILYEFPKFVIFEVFDYHDFIIFFAPLLLIVGIGLLFFILTIRNYIKLHYKNDRTRQKEITKAIASVGIIYFISNLFKNSKNTY